MSRAASTPFDRMMSASTALVVSAIAGVVLGMALVKMPPPATTDFQGQPAAPAQTTTTTTDPVAPAPVTHPRPTRTSRPSSPTATTTTTTTTTAPSTTTTTAKPTKPPKPPKPTKTTGGPTTTTNDCGLLGPILCG
ncbi:hypothetical protein JJ691_11320 [Kutzneria sp. CA-103260]|nr:hypothetical protein JJ691_11320 [Kutzneria sp. CA-103260]